MEKEKKLNQPQQPKVEQPKQELGNAPHNSQNQFAQPKQPKTQQVGNVPHNPQGGKVAQPKQPKVDPIRQKLADQGFKPNANTDFYKNSPKGYAETSKKLQDWAKANNQELYEKSTTGYYDEDPDFWMLDKVDVWPKENGGFRIESAPFLEKENGDYLPLEVKDYDELIDYLEKGNIPKEHKIKTDLKNGKISIDEAYKLLHENDEPKNENNLNKKYNVSADGNHLGQVEAKDEYEAERKAQQQYPHHTDDDVLGVEEAGQYDEDFVPNGMTKEEAESLDLDSRIQDIETRLIDLENHAPYGLSIGEQQEQKELEGKLRKLQEQKASKLFGTDLTKKEGYDIDDEPGTPVITSRLMDFAKDYLTRQGLSPEGVNNMLSTIKKDHNAADWMKKIMKEQNK